MSKTQSRYKHRHTSPCHVTENQLYIFDNIFIAISANLLINTAFSTLFFLKRCDQGLLVYKELYNKTFN